MRHDMTFNCFIWLTVLYKLSSDSVDGQVSLETALKLNTYSAKGVLTPGNISFTITVPSSTTNSNCTFLERNTTAISLAPSKPSTWKKKQL
jgi:hypothetical protein